MTKEIAIKQSYEIDFENKQMIETLKNTVAKGATDTEFKMFVEFCKSTGLNPIKKEIWFIKGKPKKYKDDNGNWREKEADVQIMTGVNGFYAIANQRPEYDGCEIIESEAKIKITEYKNKDNKIVQLEKPIIAPEWVECRVWRKDRKFPSVARAKWAEYGKEVVSEWGKITIWGQMPTVQLSKCAESMGLRKAFPQELNGLYTQEEMPKDYSMPKQENEENQTIALLPESMKSKVVVAETIKQEEVVLPFVYCFLGATEADKRLAKAEFKKMKHAIEENGVKILVKTEKKLSEKWDAYILDFPETTFKDDDLPDSFHQAKINNETINLKTGEVVE